MRKFLVTLSFLFLTLSGGCLQDGDEVVVLQEPEVPQAPVEVPPPNIPQDPDYISSAFLGDSILVDLNSLNDVERVNTRYLNMCNEYNRGLRNMDDMLGAVAKFINSISTEATLEMPAPISVNCAFRIDLRDYGISFSEWEKISRHLLLQFVDQSTRGQQIRFLTQTNTPYIFAQDAAVTSLNADSLTQNGLYYELIEQEFYLDDFFDRNVGVNVQREYDDEEAVCAAFSASQIALGKTRGVCVLDAEEFFVLTSYDSGLSAQDDHFQNPFPLEAAIAQNVLRSRKVFTFNAQEHIYFLKNGMLAFRLNGAAGTQELSAPNDVVINLSASARRLDPTIFIGSCYACHSGKEPALKFTDQLGRHIAFNTNFDAQEKELGEVFFNETVTGARLRVVDREHQNALSRLGLDEAQDSIHEYLVYPLRQEQNADQVCGYVNIPTDECLQRLAGTRFSSQVFGNILNGNTVSLAVLNLNFAQLVIDLGAYRDREL